MATAVAPSIGAAADFFSGLGTPPATTSLWVMVPTLIWGMRDPYILPQQLDGLDAYAPDLTVVRIEDGGH